ncbi:MAG: primosomal protein N', partial [Clostridia bacterium]
KLGVIIVDEEHEQSYASDQHPRYDAREVARRRCQQEGAVLLLASATPSISDFTRALRGDFTLLEMPTRVLSRPLPQVELVDMRDELARGNRGIFSGALVHALEDCLHAGHQAMLLINRRGYSTFVSCRACGYVVRCTQCDVSMTYHLDGTRMRCHYCDAEAEPPQICPSCGSRSIRYFGAGTQKVEEEIHKRFPDVSVLRMDNDTTRGKDAHATLLQKFRAGDARILIGTQMIAKGLDFPHVTMVGVVAADAMLQLPDYRSAERTFQLITQVAGRAGRAQWPGRVIVQTYDPSHYSIQTAAAQDYRAFYEQEFQRRRRSLYPPFTHMVRLLFEGE